MPDDDAVLEQEHQEELETELSDDELAMAKLKEAIEVQREEIGSLQVRLTVTIPEETLRERLHEQFVELKRDAVVPGFRKGHAPLRLIEKRFGNEVSDELSIQLVSSAYLAAVEKEEIKTLGDPLFLVSEAASSARNEEQSERREQPRLMPLKRALEHFRLPKEGSLTFSCEVEVRPEIDLPKLEGIQVRRPVVTITDDDVLMELRRVRASSGKFVPVEDGPAQADDLLYVDVVVTVDGREIWNERDYELPARDQVAMGVPLRGLGEVVVGKRRGEKIEFEAPVPDDHEDVASRGKTARFAFTINEIKRLYVPPIDQDWLENAGFENEEDLRSYVRDALSDRLDTTIHQVMREQIGQYLVDNTDIPIPDRLSRRQAERSVMRRLLELYQNGVPEEEIRKAMDEMRVKAHEQVVRDMKLFLILEKIAEEREIDVSDEEINSAIAQIARISGKRFDRVRDELSKEDRLMALALQIRDRKILDGLLDSASVIEVEGPK